MASNIISLDDLTINQNTDNNIITVDVGGVIYKTKLSTLQSAKSTMLSTLVDSKENYIFIDRNGEIFKYILDFIRGSVPYIILPDKEEDLELLEAECNYYNIPKLAELSKAKRIKEYYGVCVYCEKLLRIKDNKQRTCHKMLYHTGEIFEIKSSYSSVYKWSCCAQYVDSENIICNKDKLLNTIRKRYHVFE